MFTDRAPGILVELRGSDSRTGSWTHRAFVPDPLPASMPELSPATFLLVADARAALAALDGTARQLPEPRLLRKLALRREAHSTSALEGTYAPLAEVVTADEEETASLELVEILNYVRMAKLGFARVSEGQAITRSMLAELQGVLMRGTRLEPHAGRLRDVPVVIGRREDAGPEELPVHAARFVPPPPGDHLIAGVDALVEWMRTDHRGRIDPVVAAAMLHYQFETLHPFLDGNGRLGRYLISLHLLGMGVLAEPTLIVSPWFESRRGEYYDALLGVSTEGAWDRWVAFFARGVQESADDTRERMIRLVVVQEELKEVVRASGIRANNAHRLVDFAVANPSFTIAQARDGLGISQTNASKLVGQLVDLGVLTPVAQQRYRRRFVAPRILEVLLDDRGARRD